MDNFLVMQHVTNPVSLPLFYWCRMFLSSVTLCNTSFLTWLVHLIFSILLQHHISELARYFWSTFQTAHHAYFV